MTCPGFAASLRPRSNDADAPPAGNVSPGSSRTRRSPPGGTGVVPRHWLGWLQAPGSLTLRLRALSADLEVRLLREGHARGLPIERGLQRRGAAARLHVREVALCLDGVPCVLARSVTEAAHLRGPWRALRGLSTRPLAELLFGDRSVQRGPLRPLRIGRCGRVAAQLDRLARRAGRPQPVARAADGAVLWARSSVFVRRGSRLQVTEFFLPALLEMQARRGATSPPGKYRQAQHRGCRVSPLGRAMASTGMRSTKVGW